jgi:superfamily II DNA/RNA helicase
MIPSQKSAHQPRLRANRHAGDQLVFVDGEYFLEPKTFADLGLSAKVQQAITATGYTIPTPIQAEAIPVAMMGLDVLGIAQTGTGKTASFVLPMISRLETGRARARMPRSLILAPTRELAAQVAQSFEKYGVNHKLDLALLIGGTSMDEQSKKLDRGVDVLIATPGRLLDHMQRGRVMLMGVEILVIDEADRMLDMGFIPDIEKICKQLPPRRQSLFFSATMPPEITRLVNTFQNNPVRVEVAPPATTAKTITQKFCYIPDGEDWGKREALRGLIRADGVRNAIIFCNRKVEVAILLKSLLKHGFNAGALHGDMEQRARMETLDKFRAGEIAFLAASDVAARGLDIPDVSHVFNFDLPRDKDDYVHRIGRTGRAGKEGHSISLVTPYDLKQLADIEKIVGEPTVWTGDPPTAQDFADAGKRKRPRAGAPAVGGRGGRPATAAGRERPLAGAVRERPMPQRGAPRGPQRGGDRNREEEPQRRELLNTGQRRSAQADVVQANIAAGGPLAGRAPDATAERSVPRDTQRDGPPGARRGRDRGPARGPREASTQDRTTERQTPLDRDAPQRVTQERAPRGLEPQPDISAPSVHGEGRGHFDERAQPSMARVRHQPEGRRQEGRAQEGRAQEGRAQEGRRPEGPRADSQRRDAPRQQGPGGDKPIRNEARQQPQRTDAGGRGAFADNVPAFLQKPVRVVRSASE